MKKKKGKRKTIFEMYEPAELEMRHFTEQDNEIRNTDIPERMQLRGFPVRLVNTRVGSKPKLGSARFWLELLGKK